MPDAVLDTLGAGGAGAALVVIARELLPRLVPALDATRAEITALRAEVATLREVVAGARAHIARIEELLERAERAIEGLRDGGAQAAQRLAEAIGTLMAIRRELESRGGRSGGR